MPKRSIEIEVKYDVDETAEVPNWIELPLVSAVDAPRARSLDALYFDTTDLALGRLGYAVRRREGGHDEGWHIKGPRRPDGGREELQWSLGSPDGEIPIELLASLPNYDGTLVPIARIVNERTAYYLRDENLELMAEFVDDHVRATDMRTGRINAWREWELELADPDVPNAAELLASADRLIISVGAKRAAIDSKLAKTLSGA